MRRRLCGTKKQAGFSPLPNYSKTWPHPNQGYATYSSMSWESVWNATWGGLWGASKGWSGQL